MNEYLNLQERIYDKVSLKRLVEYVDSTTIFSVLGIEYNENIHSKMLAWLLNPKPYFDHGLKDTFLKFFLEYIIGKDFTFCPLDIEIVTEYTLVKNKKTIGRLDILIKSDKDKFLIAIENKIFAPEHNNQLDRYHKFLKNNFKNKLNYKIYLFYLTPTGKDPNITNWDILSYESISNLLEQAIKTESNSSIFAVQYVDLLKNHIIWNPTIDEIWFNYFCKKDKINSELKERVLSFKEQKIVDFLNNYENMIYADLKEHIISIISQSKYKDYNFHIFRKTKKVLEYTSSKVDNLDIFQKKMGSKNPYYNARGKLFFEIWFNIKEKNENSNKIKLFLSLGPLAKITNKNSLKKHLKGKDKLFNALDQPTEGNGVIWLTLNKKELFDFKDFTNTNDLIDKIKKQINAFIEDELCNIVDFLLK